MATITPQYITKNSGTVLTYSAVGASGDSISNPTGNTVISVKNGGSSSITVSASATKACDAGFMHNLSLAVAAGAEETIILNSRLNNASGQVPLSYSGTTDVTIAAYVVKD